MLHHEALEHLIATKKGLFHAMERLHEKYPTVAHFRNKLVNAARQVALAYRTAEDHLGADRYESLAGSYEKTFEFAYGEQNE